MSSQFQAPAGGTAPCGSLPSPDVEAGGHISPDDEAGCWRALEALAGSEARLRFVLEHSPDNIFIQDLELRYVWSIRGPLGRPPEESWGKTDFELLEDREQAQRVVDLKRRVLAENRGMQIEVPLRINGVEHWYDTTLEPWRDAAGRVQGVIAYVRDVTHHRRIEDQLRDADRRKDEFLATLAHELRNPLAPIRTAVHVLKSSAISDAQREQARDMIDRQVSHMVRLVDDLLEVSRITHGRIDLLKAPESLAQVVLQAVDAARPGIEAARHALSVSLPREPLMVDADATRLTQAVLNLINNAAKYTPDGGQIFVDVHREDDAAVVTVRDTGIGISPEILPRIFDMFVQADQDRGRGQGGLGIGLTLTRQLVELHGGCVVAHSGGRGQGSEFVIRLPLGAPARPGRRAEPASVASGLRHRVLIVDDNVDAADSLALSLELAGHTVRTAYDGQHALEIAREFDPGVVLLDIGLPYMDGYEVALRLREQCAPSCPLLVALTGWGQDEDRRRAREAGFDMHFTKPVDPDEIARFIHEASGGEEGTAAAPTAV